MTAPVRSPAGDPNRTARVLVTGSRGWRDTHAVRSALEEVVDPARRDRFVVVHGDCPSGADRHARLWAESAGVPHEPHPADWSQGRGAGPARNQQMVDLGADVCLAFLAPCTRDRCRPEPHWSHGTADCVRRARAAGIPVVEIEEGR